MASLAEWFEKQPRYQPKWERNTRVFGRWNKIPFIGSIVADREKDHILVQLDLPIRYNHKVNGVIIVRHNDIIKLKEY